jgi:hypothetical protein
MRRPSWIESFVVTAAILACAPALSADEIAWPPALRGAKQGTVTIETPRFLSVPEAVVAEQKKTDAAPFVVAKTPPRVELAFHDPLGPNAAKRRLWSCWGDICVAGDGRVYCAIGDHGDDRGGDARCFVYRWDPRASRLEQIVDMNQVVPPRQGQPAWSKVHARIDEGPDGGIYFCCTLNDGQRGVTPQYGWTDALPGGQLYRYDPVTGKTEVFANLPPRRCTATSILDRARNIWWCNLEGGGNALWGLDLKAKKVVYQTPDGTVQFNRAFALTRDGSLVFNGEGGLWRCDPAKKVLTRTRSSLGSSPGMRAVTAATKDGAIFGVTHQTNQLFRYQPAKDDLKVLGPNWLTGMYTAVCVLSPCEKYVYYLPGAHGQAFRHGTPVVQYEIATGRRKVLAFLAEPLAAEYGYVPGGTYGAKLSADGGTLYVNFNGHAATGRPAHLRADGFGLCAFASVHIPQSDRPSH